MGACEQQGAAPRHQTRFSGARVRVSVLPGGLSLAVNTVAWHLTERLL